METTSQMPERKNIFEWANKEVIFDKATILVVDDIDYNRELAKNYLSNFNFTILEAKSGGEGIEMAQLHKPDLILMDLRMPGMNGYQAADELKKLEETKDIKCVAFTASSMRHDENIIKKHFIDYLLKPITRNELIDCLMRHLPHQVHKPESRGSNLVLTDKETIPDHISSNPEKVLHIAQELTENVFPVIEKLMLTMSAEDFVALETKINKIGEQYQMTIFNSILEKMRESCDNFDYEVFDINIQKLKKLALEFIELSKKLN
jgi:CheY-like chemotaxis protein